jgi:hypothetical protein
MRVYIAIGRVIGKNNIQRILGVYTCTRTAYLNQDHDRYMVEIKEMQIDNTRLAPLKPNRTLIKGGWAITKEGNQPIYSEARECHLDCACQKGVEEMTKEELLKELENKRKDYKFNIKVQYAMLAEIAEWETWIKAIDYFIEKLGELDNENPINEDQISRRELTEAISEGVRKALRDEFK